VLEFAVTKRLRYKRLVKETEDEELREVYDKRQSPGTKLQDLASRYPNGVPAVADEYQKEWMEFLYMQQQCPEYAEGVKIKLYSIDPNGNYQDIGEVTSDLWGNYGTSWKPPVPGEYLVIAEFEGSASYGSSSASTYFVVDDALSPGQQFEPESIIIDPTEPTQISEAPFITTELAIILAAVIVAVAVLTGFWIIRKRK